MEYQGKEKGFFKSGKVREDFGFVQCENHQVLTILYIILLCAVLIKHDLVFCEAKDLNVQQ